MRARLPQLVTTPLKLEFLGLKEPQVRWRATRLGLFLVAELLVWLKQILFLTQADLPSLIAGNFLLFQPWQLELASLQPFEGPSLLHFVADS